MSAVRAEIVGSTTARANVLGYTVTVSGHHGPVLRLCRELIRAGVDPDTPLEAYRGDTLAPCTIAGVPLTCIGHVVAPLRGGKCSPISRAHGVNIVDVWSAREPSANSCSSLGTNTPSPRASSRICVSSSRSARLASTRTELASSSDVASCTMASARLSNSRAVSRACTWIRPCAPAPDADRPRRLRRQDFRSRQRAWRFRATTFCAERAHDESRSRCRHTFEFRAFKSNQQKECVRMPRKTARSGSQTPLGRSGMSGTIHPLASGLPASSENAYHPRQFRVHLGNPGDEN